MTTNTLEMSPPGEPPLQNDLAQAEPRVLLDRIKAALAVPKTERTSEWETETARLVNLAAVDYSKQSDDVVALQQLAFVGLAARRGLKQAKKLKLPLTRWGKQPPPLLDVALTEVDEVQAAIKALRPIRSAWVVPYSLTLLRSANATDSVRSDLVDWALANAEDLTELLAALHRDAESAGEQWIDVSTCFLRVLAKNPAFGEKKLGERFSVTFYNLIHALMAAAAKRAAADGKGEVAAGIPVMGLAADLLEAVTNFEPGRLTELQQVRLYFELTVAKLPGSHTRQKLATVERRLKSQLRLLVEQGSDNATKAVSAALRGIATTMPETARLFQDWARKSPELKTILESTTEEGVSEHELAEGIESAISSLLPEWDKYSAERRGDLGAAQLDAKINALAAAARIKRFGDVGEVIDYQPLRQHLIGGSELIPTHVTVRRPGVCAVRSDGTERVLLKALVAPV